MVMCQYTIYSQADLEKDDTKVWATISLSTKSVNIPKNKLTYDNKKTLTNRKKI